MGNVSIRETLIVVAVLVVSGIATVAVLANDRGPATRWRYEFGSPASAGPTLDANRVYAASEAGAVVALDAATGGTLWTVSLSATPRGLIRTDGERIYFRTDEGGVFALDAATGSVVWQRSVEGGVNTPLPRGDGVILATRRGEVISLDVTSGEEQWRTDTGRTLRADPALIGQQLVGAQRTGAQGDVIAVGDIGGRLHTFDAASGERLGEEVFGREFAGPVLVGGGVLIAAPQPAIVALTPDGGQAWRTETGEPNRVPMVEQEGVLYVDSSPDLLALDLATGAIAWRYTSPALVVTFGIGEGLAIAGMHTGEVHGIDLETGERLWRYRTNESVRGAPIIDDASGLAYFGGLDGVIYAIEVALPREATE